jgi:hypothetical protein
VEELKAALIALQQKVQELETVKQQMTEMNQNIKKSEPQLLRELVEKLKLEKEEAQRIFEQKLATQRAVSFNFSITLSLSLSLFLSLSFSLSLSLSLSLSQFTKKSFFTVSVLCTTN